MNDLYKAIDALKNIVNEAPPQGRQDGPGTRQGTPQKSKPAAPKPAAPAPRPAAVSPSPGVGRQDGPGLPKPAAPKINPAVPAAGPVRANPINPQAMAATKAAASVVNAPKPAAAPKMAMPKPKPAAPAPRAKVKATAANTKDYDKTVALQKKLGVTADGIMGPQTRAAMKAAAAQKPAATTTARAGDTPQQSGGAGGEFGPGTTRTASTTSATPRQVSTVTPGAAPAAASAQDAYAARVAKSNAALAGDVKKAARGAAEIASGGRGASGILDKITGGISDLFKPSERSVIGRKQAAAQAAPSGDFNFDDPKQNANAGGRLQTSRLAAPAAGSNAAGSNFASAADGSISRTDNPRQPGDAAPSLARRGDDRQSAATTQTAMVSPERGTVPGQGAGERTVSVGGQQVRGAEADRAINVAQAGADNARLRMGAARAGMTVKDFAAQQQKANATALRRGPSGTVNVDPNTF